jgi:hypothetical protein
MRNQWLLNSLVASALMALAFFSESVSATAVDTPIVEFLLHNNPIFDETQSRDAIDGAIAQLFRKGDFANLEHVAKEFRMQDLRTPSGLSKLNAYYFAFEKILFLRAEDDANGPQIEALVREWLKQYPNSTSAHLAYAQMLMRHAWGIRGFGYVDTVKKYDLMVFADYVEKARQYLNDHAAFRDNDPRWDLMLLEIAKLQNVSDEEYSKLSLAALDRNPDFYQLYFYIVERYLPKWGGNVEQIEKFAQLAVERTKVIEGYAVYARIYWYVSQKQFDLNLFSRSSVMWNEMKLGIDDVLKTYPDKWNIYNFAMFSCFAADKTKAGELINRIAGEKIPRDWPYAVSYERCQAFASSN